LGWGVEDEDILCENWTHVESIGFILSILFQMET